ncbi:glycosyltransferase family 4 protein [Candidatus Saccharibacteria bacterium]|nr:glycosyltransferase family 4 protein [Candidatus Saccharibacteria bacterium]
MKKNALRAVRKIARISGRFAYRGAKIFEKVEHKSTKLILGSALLDMERGRQVISVDGLLSQHLPQAMNVYPALPEKDRQPALTLFIPTLSNELIFGGIATALIVAVKFAKKAKLNLRVVQTFKYGTADVRGFLDSKGIKFNGDIVVEDVSQKNNNKKVFIDIHPDDIFMASAWADAYVIDRLPTRKKFIYLMQDFEPIFYPNGDERIRAESTYRSKNYVSICNTKLLYDHISSQNYDGFNNTFKTWFEPAVALEKRKRHSSNTIKKTLFIYGRPRVKRNLFLAAIEAVNNATQIDEFDVDAWNIYIAGEDGVPDIQLDSGARVVNLGKMPLDEYYKFVRTVDVAVSPMMAPHPNYPTLEFASVGARVITTSFGVKQSLSMYSDCIVVVDPDVGAITRALVDEIVKAKDGAVKNTDGGEIKLVTASWDDNLEDPVDRVLNHLTDRVV